MSKQGSKAPALLSFDEVQEGDDADFKLKKKKKKKKRPPVEGAGPPLLVHPAGPSGGRMNTQQSGSGAYSMEALSALKANNLLKEVPEEEGDIPKMKITHTTNSATKVIDPHASVGGGPGISGMEGFPAGSRNEMAAGHGDGGGRAMSEREGELDREEVLDGIENQDILLGEDVEGTSN